MTDEKGRVTGLGLGAGEPRPDDGGVLGAMGRTGASRRQFIKGVIASGAVVSSAGVRRSTLGGSGRGGVWSG